MVPDQDQDLYEYDNLSISSSSSSDTYSYLLHDIENPDNTVSEEWEAIERFLYEEPDNEIKNPNLLKECKLWKETFPHLRVKGNKIDLNAKENEDQSAKGTQTVCDGDPLVRINEKRDKIKKQVVGELVQRLVSKLSTDKEKCLENVSDKTPKCKINQETDILKSAKSSGGSSKEERESYFERGKIMKDCTWSQKVGSARITDLLDDDLSDLSDDWPHVPDPLNSTKTADFSRSPRLGSKVSGNRPKYFSKSTKNINSSNISKNEDILKRGNMVMKAHETCKASRLKVDRLSDSLSGLEKPFEMTKKIDKKYEPMLESIVRNTPKDDVLTKRVSTEPGATKSYRETIERIRNNNYEEYMNRHKHLPKINKFQNNWMLRTENHRDEDLSYYLEEIEKSKPKLDKSGGSNHLKRSSGKGDGDYVNDVDNFDYNFNQWFEEMKKESHSKYNKQLISSGKSTDHRFPQDRHVSLLSKDTKASPKYVREVRSSDIEEINYERPKMFTRVRDNVSKVQKSSSCVESYRKREEVKVDRTLRTGVEKGKSEVLLNKTVRPAAKTKGRPTKIEVKRNVQLPPIETGIICTELTGRPKVPAKTIPRRH